MSQIAASLTAYAYGRVIDQYRDQLKIYPAYKDLKPHYRALEAQALVTPRGQPVTLIIDTALPGVTACIQLNAERDFYYE